MNLRGEGSDRFDEIAARRAKTRATGTRLRLPAALAALAVAALIAIGMFGPLRGGAAGPTPDAPTSPSAGVTPTGSNLAVPTASQSISASPSPSAVSLSGLPDPRIWAGDARLKSCAGPPGLAPKILTIFEMPHASDYWKRLPTIGYLDQLERADPALIVVYDGASPEDLVVDMPRMHTPAPGTFDICVGLNDRHRRLVNVPVNWTYLSGAADAAKPNIVAKLPSNFWMYGSNLVWDQGRGLLWYAVVACGDASAVYAFDPSTSQTRQWSIPSNTFGNCDPPQIGVDGSGAVWVMENSLVVRFWLATGTVQSVRVAPALVEPSKFHATASFPTAMAFDGDTALIARFDTATLTRVSLDMAVSAVPIPAEIAGADGLAVSGGRIYALAGGKVAVLPMTGLSPSPAATAARSTVIVHPGPNPPLIMRPDGSVVRWTGLVWGVVLGADGSATGPVTVPGVPPFAAAAHRFATDWTSRSWYVLGESQQVVAEARS